MTDVAPFVELRGVTKRFPGVVAVRDVSIGFRAGTVHALLGENGAGKSTLVKIISGIYAPDEGQLLFEGRPVRLRFPADAERHGVAVVHQHRTLVDDLSVAENLFLGRLGSGWSPFDRAAWRSRAGVLLERVGLKVDPDAKVRHLSPAEQQFLEIARAIGRSATTSTMRWRSTMKSPCCATAPWWPTRPA
ncbi:MAG: sugar ABC transporter ATP-binding protein [Rhizobiales bacterium]|nr:sugar ABC transporter ATP-binding protein [Hyphomicrobiales bacterium]